MFAAERLNATFFFIFLFLCLCEHSIKILDVPLTIWRWSCVWSSTIWGSTPDRNTCECACSISLFCQFRNRFNDDNLKNTYICKFALRTHCQSRGCPRGRVQGLSVVPRSGSGGATFPVEHGGKTVCLGFIPKPEQSGHLVDDTGFTDAGTLK